MAYDKNGVEINIGDTVLIPCIVTDVYNFHGEDKSNVRLLTIHVDADGSSTALGLEGSQVVLDNAPGQQIAPRKDGPTLEEYVAAGYTAGGYPPHGYEAKPSPGLDAFRAGNPPPANAAGDGGQPVDEVGTGEILTPSTGT